jgi:predicted N-acetyltransferase YhbS
LNDWLRQRALKNESRFSRTYVVCEGDHVVGYFCVSAGAVERAAAPGKVRRNAPDTIPVSVVGRLAVSRSHAGRGLGADLLSDALRRIALASQSIGRYVGVSEHESPGYRIAHPGYACCCAVPQSASRRI